MIAAVAAIHLAFIAFVAFGGFLVLRWRKLAWLHIPAVIWGVLIELFPWTCPLTTVETRSATAARIRRTSSRITCFA